jgi:hypothetical protein
MNKEQAALMAQVIPVIALAAIVELRGVLTPRNPNIGDEPEADGLPTARSGHAVLPPASVLLIFLVFALTILAAGETRAFLVIFGFGRNLGAVFMTAKNELVATIVVATNLIFLVPAGQALTALLTRWNAAAAKAPSNRDSVGRQKMKEVLRLGGGLALLIALYARVIILA